VPATYEVRNATERIGSRRSWFPAVLNMSAEDCGTVVFQEKSVDNRKEVRVNRPGIIVKAHGIRGAARQQAAVAATARTEPASRGQDVNTGKTLHEMPLQHPIVLVDVDPDFGRLRVACEDFFQNGDNRASPVVGGDDDGDRRFLGHDQSRSRRSARA